MQSGFTRNVILNGRRKSYLGKRGSQHGGQNKLYLSIWSWKGTTILSPYLKTHLKYLISPPGSTWRFIVLSPWNSRIPLCDFRFNLAKPTKSVKHCAQSEYSLVVFQINTWPECDTCTTVNFTSVVRRSFPSGIKISGVCGLFKNKSKKRKNFLKCVLICKEICSLPYIPSGGENASWQMVTEKYVQISNHSDRR